MSDMTLVAKGNGYIGSAGPRVGALLASETRTGEYTQPVQYRVEGMIAQILRHTNFGGGGRAFVRPADLQKIKRDAAQGFSSTMRQSPGQLSFWRAVD